MDCPHSSSVVHQTTSIKQYHLIKESLHQIRGEHARLAERQLFIDQQTKQIHQRFLGYQYPRAREYAK
ncbi:unnamed protein product [Rotaria magnacalcarata]